MRGMAGTRSDFVEWPVVTRNSEHRHCQYAEAEASETCDERPHGDHETYFPVVCGGGGYQELELGPLRAVVSQLKSKEETRLDGFGGRPNLFRVFNAFAAVAN